MLYRYTDDAELVEQLVKAARNVVLYYDKDDQKSYYRAAIHHQEQLRKEILRRLAAVPKPYPIMRSVEMAAPESTLYETEDDKIHDIVDELKTLSWQGLSVLSLSKS